MQEQCTHTSFLTSYSCLSPRHVVSDVIRDFKKPIGCSKEQDIDMCSTARLWHATRQQLTLQHGTENTQTHTRVCIPARCVAVCPSAEHTKEFSKSLNHKRVCDLLYFSIMHPDLYLFEVVFECKVSFFSVLLLMFESFWC